MKIHKVAQNKITTAGCVDVLKQHISNRDDLWKKSYFPRKDLMIIDEATRRPMFKDWQDYKEKHIARLEGYRWWKRKIGNEIARLFSIFGFDDYMMIIYESNGVFTRIEYYDNVPKSGIGESLIDDKTITVTPIVTESL